MKNCPKCNEIKSLDSFYRNKASKTGRASWCKECSKGLSLYSNLSPDVIDKERARKKKYKRDNPSVVAAISRRTYAKRKLVPIEATTAQTRQFMLENENCMKCGSDKDLTLDHIIPMAWINLSRHAIDNLQVLCNTCNGLKKDVVSIDFRELRPCLLDIRDLL